MELCLRLLPVADCQVLIDLCNRLEHRATELHPAFNNVSPIIADDPLRRVDGQRRRRRRCGIS